MLSTIWTNSPRSFQVLFKFPSVSAHPQVFYSSTGTTFAMWKTILWFCCVGNKRSVNRHSLYWCKVHRKAREKTDKLLHGKAVTAILICKFSSDNPEISSRENEGIDKLYYVCQSPEYGKMIGCDHPECEYEVVSLQLSLDYISTTKSVWMRIPSSVWTFYF